VGLATPSNKVKIWWVTIDFLALATSKGMRRPDFYSLLTRSCAALMCGSAAAKMQISHK